MFGGLAFGQRYYIKKHSFRRDKTIRRGELHKTPIVRNRC